jgi:hypothetical protein
MKRTTLELDIEYETAKRGVGKEKTMVKDGKRKNEREREGKIKLRVHAQYIYSLNCIDHRESCSLLLRQNYDLKITNKAVQAIKQRGLAKAVLIIDKTAQYTQKKELKGSINDK